MNKSNILITSILALLICQISCSGKNNATYQSTKEERNLLKSGKKEFVDSNYVAALQDFTQALAAAPGSEPAIFDRASALYNYAQTQPDGRRDSLTAQAVEIYETLGKHGLDLEIREKANYNLGNIAFAQQDYKKSIEYYKRVLRSNPANQRTRENLRVAQLKLPPEDENQNQDQQDQQDQQQDQQEQQQEQQQQPQPNQAQQQEMSGNAEQILQTMQNRENQTRENAQKEERQAIRRTTDKPW